MQARRVTSTSWLPRTVPNLGDLDLVRRWDKETSAWGAKRHAEACFHECADVTDLFARNTKDPYPSAALELRLDQAELSTPVNPSTPRSWKAWAQMLARQDV